MDRPTSRQTSGVEVPLAAEGSPAGTRSAGPRLDFRTIFELEAAYVARTLRRLGVDAADVEDMAHEVFLAVHRQLGDYDPSRPLKPWLFGFAFRVASHYRRKSTRPARGAEADVEVADPSAPADVIIERAERRQMVLDALESIELGRRAVFVMVELDGIAAPAIAESLGIPLPTVHSRLRLARQEFAKAIQRLRAKRGTP